MTTRLTELAQAAVRERIRPGDVAIDATAGNGHDTVFLADAVGPGGRVFAFDTQPAAIRATRRRLHEQGVAGSVTLIEDCHSRLAQHVPADAYLSAVMFNLGYLPGSDKAVVTKPATTLVALAACRDQLAERGVMTVMAYRGHRGGSEETSAIAAWLDSLEGERDAIERHEAPGEGPLLWVIRRRSG